MQFLVRLDFCYMAMMLQVEKITKNLDRKKYDMLS